jgi:hypothetical protein
MSLFKLIFCILIALTINSVLCITPFPVGTTWDLQYSGKIDLSHNVMAYDLDLFDTSKSVIDDLHKRGIKMICYFSAGSY